MHGCPRFAPYFTAIDLGGNAIDPCSAQVAYICVASLDANVGKQQLFHL